MVNSNVKVKHNINSEKYFLWFEIICNWIDLFPFCFPSHAVPVCSHVKLIEHVAFTCYFHGSCDTQGSFVFSKFSEVAHACCGLCYTNESGKLTRATGQLHKAFFRSLAFWPLTYVFVRPSRCKRDVSQQSWSFAIFEAEAKPWWLRKDWHVYSYKASFLFLHLNIALD